MAFWLEMDLPMESELRLEAMKRQVQNSEDLEAMRADFQDCLNHLVHKEHYLRQAILHIAELEQEEIESDTFQNLVDRPRPQT